MGLKSDLNFTEIHWPMSQITLRRNGLYLGGRKKKSVKYLVFKEVYFT